MKFFFKEMKMFNSIHSLINEIINIKMEFPYYVFKEPWCFLPIMADSTGGNDGAFHNFICNKLNNSCNSYYMACFDECINYFENFPIVELFNFDSAAQLNLVWRRLSFRSQWNEPALFIENTQGFTLYFDESKNWIVFDILDLNITLLGCKDQGDVSYFKRELLKCNYVLYDEMSFKDEIKDKISESEYSIFYNQYMSSFKFNEHQ